MEKDPRQGQTTIRSVRPWGDIHMIVRNQRTSVDLTHVKPGERASLHVHHVRSEFFHFIDGGGFLELDGVVHRPEAHDEFMILPEVRHRFWAENTSFRILVLSFGDWTAEDQERLADDYGRQGTPLEL